MIQLIRVDCLERCERVSSDVMVHFRLDGREAAQFTDALLMRVFASEFKQCGHEVVALRRESNHGIEFLTGESVSSLLLEVRTRMPPRRVRDDAASVVAAMNLLIPMTDSCSDADGRGYVEQLSAAPLSRETARVAREWLAEKIRAHARDAGTEPSPHTVWLAKRAVSLFSERLGMLDRLWATDDTDVKTRPGP